MIADFYKAIIKPKPERVLPAKVVKVLNRQLPRGYQYEPDGNGHYIVKPSSKQTAQHFTGTVNYDKSGIPKEITPDLLGDYVYRTQKTIFFDEVKIVDGEKTIDFSDIYTDPITGEKAEVVQEFMMFPEPFPPAIPMRFITYDEDDVTILFRRVPYDSMDHVRFENVSFPALTMIWTLPEKDKSTKLGPGIINLSATPSKAETVDDAILSLKIVKSFAKKTLRINGTAIGKDLNGATDLDNDELESKMRFWGAFKSLEEILNIKFNPTADYPEKDQRFASELFYNFLDGKDFIYTKPFTQFHINFNGLFDREKACHELIGKKNLSLSFVENARATLMGAEFFISQASVLVNMNLDNIVFDEDNQGAELFISDAHNATFMMIKRYYRNEEEAKKGMERIYKEYSH